jgi:hypothetical protein
MLPEMIMVAVCLLVGSMMVWIAVESFSPAGRARGQALQQEREKRRANRPRAEQKLFLEDIIFTLVGVALFVVALCVFGLIMLLPVTPISVSSSIIIGALIIGFCILCV